MSWDDVDDLAAIDEEQALFDNALEVNATDGGPIADDEIDLWQWVSPVEVRSAAIAMAHRLIAYDGRDPRVPVVSAVEQRVRDFSPRRLRELMFSREALRHAMAGLRGPHADVCAQFITDRACALRSHCWYINCVQHLALTGSRLGRTYCSPVCRKSAYNRRKRELAGLPVRTFNIDPVGRVKAGFTGKRRDRRKRNALHLIEQSNETLTHDLAETA